MSTLSSIVQGIVTAGDSEDRVARNLLQLLKSANPRVLANTQELEVDPLEGLNPAQHTLGYLFILVSRLQVAKGHDHIHYLLGRANNFSCVFNYNQAWLAPDQMNAFADCLANIADRLERPSLPIAPLLRCISKAPNFDAQSSSSSTSPLPAPHHLTYLHHVVLKYCLLAKMYRHALPILDQDISALSKSAHSLKVQDFMLYYYYGAMVYIGLKKFARALEFLHLCISTPANATSAIQIEAYRKFILVSLIVHGKVVPNLKYTSPIVSRVVQVHSQPYLELAKAYDSGSFSKLQTELAKCQEVMTKHSNFGLAKQCTNALICQKVLNLNNTYLTLSLADISKLIGQGPSGSQLNVDEVEALVATFVERNQVYASISHADNGMVFFHDSPESYQSAETGAKIEKQLRKAMDLARTINDMDETIGASRSYLEKLIQSESRGDSRSMGTFERLGSSGSFDADDMAMNE
ncbi:hypothetical protein HDV05_006196 [Chytridiales sp. JEL 0842]|nr:hypothetical protein HDV05_006196 [Chytridiales sp. JEL 0842]